MASTIGKLNLDLIIVVALVGDQDADFKGCQTSSQAKQRGIRAKFPSN